MSVSARNLPIAIAVAALAAAASAPAALAQAAATPPPAAASGTPAPPSSPVIAIIDIDRILQQSTAAQGVRAAAEKYQKGLVDQENQVRGTLEQQQQDLERQRATLSADAFAQKQRAFDQNVAEQQRQDVLRRQALEKSYETAMGKIQEAVAGVSREVAQTYGANFVILRNAAFLFDSRADITDPVVAEVNKRLTKVDFPAPKVDASAAAAAPPPLTGGGPVGGAPGGGLNLNLPH